MMEGNISQDQAFVHVPVLLLPFSQCSRPGFCQHACAVVAWVAPFCVHFALHHLHPLVPASSSRCLWQCGQLCLAHVSNEFLPPRPGTPQPAKAAALSIFTHIEILCSIQSAQVVFFAVVAQAAMRADLACLCDMKEAGGDSYLRLNDRKVSKRGAWASKQCQPPILLFTWSVVRSTVAARHALVFSTRARGEKSQFASGGQDSDKSKAIFGLLVEWLVNGR